MNLIAAGAYLKGLREAQGLSQGRVAELVGVTTNTIWRIESGKQEPKALQIVNLLTTLRGRVEDLAKLMNSGEATAADGEVAARVAIATTASQMSPEERSAAADRLRQLAEDIAAGRVDPPR